MKKLTPVFVVEDIKPCLNFWVERMDFEAPVKIPEGDSLGFVILTRGNVEIMYQSRESLRKDIPALADEPPGSPNAIYIEVSDLDDVLRRLEGIDLVVPKRTTFYGATEVGVREPGGNLIVFAMQGQEEGADE
jgi:uncharacterized glyoxalase superfamily protein PhnB